MQLKVQNLEVFTCQFCLQKSKENDFQRKIMRNVSLKKTISCMFCQFVKYFNRLIKFLQETVTELIFAISFSFKFQFYL